MKPSISVVMILVLGFTLVLGAALYAQIKKDPKTGEDRISGRIQMINKDKSTLEVVQNTSTKGMWLVAFNDKTVITILGKAAKIQDLKEGINVIVLGKYEKNALNASRIDMQSEK